MDKSRLKLNSFTLLMVLILMGGCESLFVSVDSGSPGKSEATSDETDTPSTPVEIPVLSFSGIDSISNVGPTTVTINWTHIAGATSYEVYNVTSGEILLTNVDAPTATYNATGLTAGTSYDFRVRAKNSAEVADTNTNDQTAVTLLSFPGIDSISSVATTTATINWTHIAGASSYEVYDVTGASSFVASITAPTATYNLTGLTVSSTTKYRVRAKNSAALEDTNTNDISLTTLPVTPSGIALTTPSVTPGLDSTLEVTVSGVKNGDSVKLFSDNTCTTQVGSATASGATVQITTSSLAVGSYTFYANTADAAVSACSSANVAYEFLACPSQYVLVPADSTVGTANNFCVMKYEAKNDTGDAVSKEDVTPWVGLSMASARQECQDLNTGGITEKYDLISNAEWMTIARNLEEVPANWTNNNVGVIGTECMLRGNVGAVLTCNGVNSGYNHGSAHFGAGRSTTAEMTLDNGNTIWDFSGNVWEWVNWTLDYDTLYDNVAQGDKPYVLASTGPVQAWIEVSSLDTFPGAIAPATSVLPSHTTYTSAEGTGHYFAQLDSNTARGAPVRGGQFSNGASAGIYALQLWYDAGNGSGTGFRCVFRQ